MFEVVSGSSLEEIDVNLKDMLPGLFQGRGKRRRLRVPEAGTAVRLLAWSPVAVGSAVTLLGALRYLEPAR